MSDEAAYITPDLVQRLRADLEKARVREAKAKQRREVLERMVRDAEALVSLDAPDTNLREPVETVPLAAPRQPAAVAQRHGRRAGKSWTATIKRIVVTAARGMTYGEVKEELLQSHLGDTLRRTEKAFYGGIAKLCDRGDLVKHGGRLYSPKAYQQFMEDVAAGRVVDEPAVSASDRQSPNHAAILDLLSGKPSGAPSKELLDSLLSSPPNPHVSTNRGSLFNALAKLREKGEVVKRGERYYLPTKRNEPPASDGGGSESDGVAAPSFESRGQTSFLG